MTDHADDLITCTDRDGRPVQLNRPSPTFRKRLTPVFKLADHIAQHRGVLTQPYWSPRSCSRWTGSETKPTKIGRSDALCRVTPPPAWNALK